MIEDNAVWFVTGCSKGLGRALAKEIVTAGHRLVATARNAADVEDLVSGNEDRVLALALDVTESDQIKAAVAAAKERFGQIDVLVNNAGYGYLGAVEEGEDADVRAQFETNLFGPINLIKAVLPDMRARKHGSIVNVSSIGGFVTFPGVGYYHMAKFGVEAMSETLAKELAPLGINVTVVAPGAFRTDFRGGSIKQSSQRIDDYAETAGKGRDGTLAGDGKQRGDPVLGARAIIEAVSSDKPPVHLIIGGDALDQFRGKIDELQREADAWETLTRSTDLQDASATKAPRL